MCVFARFSMFHKWLRTSKALCGHTDTYLDARCACRCQTPYLSAKESGTQNSENSFAVNSKWTNPPASRRVFTWVTQQASDFQRHQAYFASFGFWHAQLSSSKVSITKNWKLFHIISSSIQDIKSNRGFQPGYHGLVTRGHLKPNEWLLATGAGGGMGSMAVELGKAVGAKVLGTPDLPWGFNTMGWRTEFSQWNFRWQNCGWRCWRCWRTFSLIIPRHGHRSILAVVPWLLWESVGRWLRQPALMTSWRFAKRRHYINLWQCLILICIIYKYIFMENNMN